MTFVIAAVSFTMGILATLLTQPPLFVSRRRYEEQKEELELLAQSEMVHRAYGSLLLEKLQHANGAGRK